MLYTTVFNFFALNWIDDIRQNGDVALNQIYEGHRSYFISWLHRTYRIPKSEAIDIFQEVLITCYDNVMTGKVTTVKSELKFYLLGIAKNKAMESMRTRNKRIIGEKNYNLLFDFDDEESQTMSNQNYSLLEKMINELGDPCKTLLILFYYHQLKLDLIMVKMNYNSRDTVKTKKYKCIKRLQNTFFQHK